MTVSVALVAMAPREAATSISARPRASGGCQSEKYKGARDPGPSAP
jgi:hypothetical protein